MKILVKLVWGLLCASSIIVIVPTVLYCLSRIFYVAQDLFFYYFNYLQNYFGEISAALIAIISSILFIFGLLCAVCYAFEVKPKEFTQ